MPDSLHTDNRAVVVTDAAAEQLAERGLKMAVFVDKDGDLAATMVAASLSGSALQELAEQ